MSLSQPCRHRVAALLLLLALGGFCGLAAAQTAPEWELFDLPERADLILGAVPDSVETVAILPAEGSAVILLDSRSFEEVTLNDLDPVAWEARSRIELRPGDTLVLHRPDGAVWKMRLSPPLNAVNNDPVSLQYALLNDPQVTTPPLRYSSIQSYDALDLSSGDIFSDETVASVIFCDNSVIEPTPTPSVVPEPGSFGLVLLGLFGVLFSWRIARRQGKIPPGPPLRKGGGRWWMLLLLLSLCTLVQGVDVEGLLAQSRACLLQIEREGAGSGRVIGEGIDCGESCSLSSGSGDVLHVKAIADENSRFLEWQVNGGAYTGLYRMSGDTILTAVFDAKHPPLAVNDRYHTDEDVELQVPAPGFLENDSDPDGDAIDGELVTPPLHGDLTLNPDGSFSYTPDADFHGIDQFLYRASDGELQSAIAVVTIEVSSLGDVPSADDLNVETVMDTPVNITLQGHDPDGDSLLYRIVDLPENGELYGSDEHFEYTPNPGFVGQDSFRYLVNDGTTDSNLATVTITVRDIDLAIGAIDLSDTVFDPHNMTLSGNATVSVENSGSEVIDGGYTLQLFVKDLQQDSTSELGIATISESLAPGDTLTVDVPVKGLTPFKDAPVYAFVDSEDAIAESNEENNISHSLVDCQMKPAAPGSFDPVLKFFIPAGNTTMATPMVVNITDDNGDGKIDERDVPDLIFPRMSSGQFSGGPITALSGDDGRELFQTIPSIRIAAINEIAVADIDDDTFPEIVAARQDGRHLLAFEHTGELKWQSDTDTLPGRYDSCGAISIANLDGVGLPEIVIGASVYSAEGKLLADGRDLGGTTGFNYYTAISAVADVNLDGLPEIIAGPSVYHFSEGRLSLLWRRSDMIDGFSGIANFDDDPYPEIVLVGSGRVSLLNHDGTRAESWNPGGAEYVSLPGGGYGGAPTIADLDGDGLLEIGVAGGSRYAVFNHDGSLLWASPMSDGSSTTGSTAFDFEGDGRVEVVYRGTSYLRIYRGADGAILFQYPMSSATASELPVVADIDRDGNAEIVVSGNGGIFAFEDANDSWVNTRKIWNQHSYHITNVNDDATIPQFEAKSWEEHNTYRCNLSADALACEDYSASYVRVDATDFPNSATITARIGNSGIVDAAFPLNVAFYHGDPQNGGTLLGTTTTQDALVSGDYEDVSLVWNAPPLSQQTVFVVVDDDGSGQGRIRESDETNNTASTTVFFNAPPVAADDAYSTDEDLELQVGTPGVLSNDTDANGETLSVVLVEEPEHGRLALNADGSFSYTPEMDFFGQDQFRYYVSDGSRVSEASVVRIEIAPINDAPSITTTPVLQAVFHPQDVDIEALNFADWTVTQFAVGDHNVNGQWVFNETKTTATQTLNADPSVLLSDFDVSHEKIEGTWRVNTGSDDDLMGFVFGYQDPQHFYLFDWKQSQQSWAGSLCQQGMSVKRIAADSPLTWQDFWQTSGIENRTTLLYHNTIAYQDFVDYRFTLLFFPGRFTIVVEQEGQVLDQITIFDDTTYSSGKFGFYNYSQSHVQYTRFARQISSEPTYHYHVEAMDLDSDSLNYSLLNHPDGMLIDPVSGEIVWYPTEEQIGEHTVEILVEDGDGGVDTQRFLVAVTGESNTNPTIVSFPRKVTFIGEDYKYPVEAIDEEQDPLHYALLHAPDGMAIDEMTGLVSWLPAEEQLGEQEVSLRVSDGRGGFDEQRYTLYVLDANQPPQITSTAVTHAMVDTAYAYDVDAVDSAYDRLTYTLEAALEGMLIDPVSGAIVWTPTFAQSGEHAVNIRVTDLLGLSDTQEFTLTVESLGLPPQVRITAPADGTECEPGDSLAIEAEAGDPDGEIVKVAFSAENITFGGDSILFGEDETAAYTVPWTILEPGVHQVTARATDDSGAWTDSASIHIIVQNGPPEIVSEPSYSAPIGELYSYDVEAIDPNDDTLSYSLEYGPDGMTIDAETGVVSWPPSAAQVGQQQYRVIVEDGRGAGAGQTVDCFVPEPDNTPPQIVSEPVFTARVGEDYTYDVEATDADNDPLSFRFMKAPEGMGLNPQSGLITWSPSEAQIGTHVVTIVADDGRNGIGGQTYSLTVRPENVPPTVSISAPAEGRKVEEGSVLTIRAEASDSDDGIEHVEFFIDAEAGVQSSDCSGASSATTCELDWPAAGLGEHTVYAVATDKAGTSTESEPVTFTVTESFGDFLRPEISLTISATVVNPGDTITVWVQATDNKGIASTSVTVNGEEIPLNPDGSAGYTVGDEAEILVIEASATDAEGNSGSVSREVRVLVPGDTTDPAAEIAAPEVLTKIYTPTEILGTASDDNLLRYTLDYSPKDRKVWTTFAEGTESVSDGVLGTLDPTLLLNGLYDIRLSVEDASGNISIAETVYQVDGNMKIGLFTISFNDLTIPVSGIPITVTRTYDSRDKLPGDFGTGWTLSTSNITLEESAVPGNEWEQVTEGGGSIMNPFTTYRLKETTPHKVTVTYPGGTSDEFRVVVTPRQSFPYKVEYVDVTFEAESGTFSTLEALESGSGLMVVGNVNGPAQLADPDSWDEYNPNRYRLTRMDGTVIVLNQDSGIESITEPNGNVLTFTENGIEHSNGKSVQFIRDPSTGSGQAGRITEIIDPLGASVSYEYDSYGDLVKVSDQEGFDTRFTYEGNHYLKDIIDPRGVRATRNEYDEHGRLVATIDPDGHRIEFDHDLDGRTEVIRDRLGYPTIISYDDRGNVLQETDAEGHTKKYTYDERDNLLVEEDQRGYSWAHSYTGKDLMASKSNPLGYTVSASYNAKGQVKGLKDSTGTLLENIYDAKGNLQEIKEANGAVSRFSYNEQGQPESYRDQLEKLMQFAYDGDGNVNAMTDPDGNTIGFSYDENGRVLQKSSRRTGPNGAETLKTLNVYDHLGRLVHNTDAEGYSSEVVYNAIGKQSAYTDKRGFKTEYVYDALGNLERVIYPDGSEESYTYDAEGRTLSSTNRQGKSSSYEYDKVGRQTSASAPDGSTTSSEYDARGQVLAQTDELGRTTRYVYDEAGRNTLVTNAIGQQTEYAYTLNGSLQSMTDAAGHVTSYQYDANGRRTGTSFADGSSVGSTYDEAGRVLSERDQAGRETQYAYDWRGKLLSVTDALNQVTTFSYDEVGNMLTQTDAEGQTTRFEYDNLGRMTRRILPLGQSAAMRYDGEDNLIETTDFNGETISFDYDSDGRVLSKDYPDGSRVSYVYAPDGSQDTIEDLRGTITLSYDEMGRLERKDDPETGTLEYDYDQSGSRTAVSSPSGEVSYTYDELNRLETVVDPQTGTTRYSYDTVGNLNTVSYPNGTVATYEYDLLNRLTLLENRGSDGSIISSYAYTLDAAGNRTRVEEFSGRVVDYVYDATDRLLEERITNSDGSTSAISYTYDKVGNRLTKIEDGVTTTYSYDANNRLIQEDEIVYHYDDNGNLTKKSGIDEEVRYAYDAENHLIRAETTRFGVTIVVEYEYDANGNRVKKSIDGTITTTYLVDENRGHAQVLEERDGEGNLIVRYVYGHDLISQTRDGSTTYYHYDGLGSTRALTSQIGIITDTYDYDAFGLLIGQTGTRENQYLFAGEQFDPELGFYYLRARYMSPALGRFVTMDSFAGHNSDPVTLHKYLYANANPVSYIDPSGYQGFLSSLTSSNMMGNLSKIRVSALNFAALHPKLVGTISGAVISVTDAWLGGERAIGNLALYAVAGGVGGASAGFIVQFPKAMCILRVLAPLLVPAGLGLELQGIKESIQNEEYDQAAFRIFFAYFTVKATIHVWKNATCFTGETLIATKDGQRPIEDIAVGDDVYSEDTETGKKTLKKVKEVFVRETDVLIHLMIHDETITTTPEHPFWVIGKGWVAAGALNAGNHVKLSSGDSAEVTFLERELLTEAIPVYNFEVEETHTYFVGKDEILVHNTCNVMEGFRQAQEALEDFFTNNSKSQARKIAGNVAIAAVDPFNPENIVIGKSKGGIPKNLHKKLKAYLKGVPGGIEHYRHSPGACAEIDAANQLLHLNENLNPEDILFSTPTMVRKQIPQDVCLYCQHVFSQHQFAPGTGFESW